MTWFHGKSGGVLRFLSLSLPLSASLEFRYLAHFMPPRSVVLVRRYRLEWRLEREQKEARSTAVKWRLATDKREKERERGRERGALWNWSDLGRERIQSPSSSLASSRPLSATHRNLLRMSGRLVGRSVAWPAKNPEPDPNYKSCGR